RVRLWDSTTGSQLIEPLRTSLASTLKPFGRRPVDFDFSNRFFACGWSNVVQIVDLKSRTSRELVISNGLVSHLAFRPGADELAIGAGHVIEIWKSSGLARERAISQPERVRWVGFSPEGRRLLFLLKSGTARIVNPESGALEVELQNPSSSAIFDIHF